MFKDIYKNKKVLVTGNTGFKGSWLVTWLHILGAETYAYSNGVPTEPALFEEAGHRDFIRFFQNDIRDLDALTRVFDEIRPDFVFHLAAQPIVRESLRNPRETIETNVMGTCNVLEALRLCGRKVVAVIVTSDKVYRNQEWTWGYREIDELGGKDPYSASKAGAELACRTYASSFFEGSPIRLSTGRAGNVIGGGDWADGRIVPDVIRAWRQGGAAEIRNAQSTRPWQFVLEPLGGYLLLGQRLADGGLKTFESFNFGPAPDREYTVGELLEEMRRNITDLQWESRPDPRAALEARLLRLNCDKALQHLEWRPNLTFQETIRFTADWYREFYGKAKPARQLTEEQIRAYCDLAAERELIWTI